jgi:D-alanine-D-alanine ligase
LEKIAMSDVIKTPSRSSDPQELGRVVVLMGGHSAEREISLQSGEAVLQALLRLGVDAIGLDVRQDVIQRLGAGGFDRAFVALHGRGGEDGVIQGALELLGIAYTGSGVLGAAVSMDKLRTKQMWRGAGLSTPPWTVLRSPADFPVAISNVDAERDLPRAWEEARRYGRVVFAERWVTGSEYTAGLLGDEALPLIRVETPHTFYDYDAKYRATDTRFHCPCGLDSATEAELQSVAHHAFEAVGCQGWGRVDMLRDGNDESWLIEVNSVPGMTDHSLVPMAARAAGIEFDELVWRILLTSTEPREKSGQD